MSQKINWSDESVLATLHEAVAGVEEVSQEVVAELAEKLGGSVRAVGTKIRTLGYTVAKASKKATIWTPEMEAQLSNFLEANAGVYTYGEIAQILFSAVGITDKQVQGKILSMKLTDKVKPAPKRENVRSYTAEQEETYVQMALAGSSLEDIATALGVSIPSARGKGLSLVKEGRLEAQPVQVTSTAARRKDPLDGLDVANESLADLCAHTNMTERGVKQMLTRRGLACKDYDGAKRRSSLDAKKEATE